MIEDLLPHYYEAYETNFKYTILRSIVIEGHESAWMRGDGVIEWDITQQGREGQAASFYTFECECNFTEFVGWEVRDGRRYTLEDKEHCLRRKAACDLRKRELRAEYIEQFNSRTFSRSSIRYEDVQAVILDLIERAKNHEFIGEDTNGANFWGGYFYLQTVADICNISMQHIWDPVNELRTQHKIGLEGMVVTPYRLPEAIDPGDEYVGQP